MRTGHEARHLRILLAAENISLRLSGETIVPFQYFRHFLDTGHDVRVVCHARVRDDLRLDLSDQDFARIHFVEDSALQRVIYALGRRLPYRIEDLVSNQLIQLVTQLRMRKLARALIREHDIDVVFQPTPLAAKALSFMYALGRPVVIGPMSGGMELPDAFRHLDGPVVRRVVQGTRAAAALLHRIVPGKLAATALIVANARTRAALPAGTRGRIYQVMESAVDLVRWQLRPPPSATGRTISYIFCSRFVDWKGIGYLVRAFSALARDADVRLDLVGDGELFETIRDQVRSEGLGDRIVLHGRLPIERYIALLEQADVFVTPSLRECGGMAMMEAMAIGVPVIGVDWAGAAQYANHDCAILVDPVSEQGLIDGLTAAMRSLAESPELRRRLGAAGRQHLEDEGLGWDSKARQILHILDEAVALHRKGLEPHTPRVRAAVPNRQVQA